MGHNSWAQLSGMAPPVLRSIHSENARQPAPPQDFRRLSIFPSAADLKDTKPYIRPNIVQGGYNDVQHYLDVQFRLLREDVFKPLREGIQAYKMQLMQGSPLDGQGDVKVYSGVVIIGAVATQWGVNYKIRFDATKSAAGLMDSKRLIFGSQIVLSSDAFETIYVATVQEKNDGSVAHGELEVKFEAESAARIQRIDYSVTEFVMVETPAYFEAYRHVLEGLQELNTENLPFQDYLVRCDSTRHVAPAYLKRTTTYDLSCLATEVRMPSASARLKCIRVLHEDQWPAPGDLRLDSSQMEALKRALTREFTIIQGPPGTGKTYIGLKIVQALLANQPQPGLEDYFARWAPFSARGTSSDIPSSPILVVCYTNHALDQFLEGILKSVPRGVIRVGGRSTSKKLTDCLLSKQKDRHLRVSAEQRKIFGLLRGAVQDLCDSTAVLSQKALLSDRGIIKYSVLKEFIPRSHRHHVETLMYGRSSASSLDPLVEWLNLHSLCLRVGGGAAPEFDVSREPGGVVGEERRLEQQQRLLDGFDDDYTRKAAWFRMEKLEREELAINFYALAKGSAEHQQRSYGRLTELVKRKSISKRLLLRLRSTRPMQPHEERDASSPELITLDARWRLYMTWVCRYRKHLTDNIITSCRGLDGQVSQLKDLRQDGDVAVLKEAKVIGMTTTAAARIRRVLQLIKPRVVIVEEAAEVLEAHIVAMLSSGCEHLILIGDHKQLRPNPTSDELAKSYHLDVSLFERMVNNSLPYTTLTTQRRMRPEISLIMKRNFYPALTDHPSVANRESVSGVTTNMFYVKHSYPEERDEIAKSYRNPHEAMFVVALCAYLLRRGYNGSQITILSPYNGQLNLIRPLATDVSKDIRISSIDGYQGEENDIVLFSIVRSNERNSLGFTDVANRVCVALSRAKHGFYVFGNFDMLARCSRLWRNIVHHAKEMGAVGDHLELICTNHKRRTAVSRAEDFMAVPMGGCSLRCGKELKCGHRCPLPCHDGRHDTVKCQSTEPCFRVLLECGHRCPLRCCDPCAEICTKRIEKKCRCGHKNVLNCYELQETRCCRCRLWFNLERLSSFDSDDDESSGGSESYGDYGYDDFYDYGSDDFYDYGYDDYGNGDYGD